MAKTENGLRLQTLCTNEQHYLKCLLQYEKRVAWLPIYKEWVNTHMGRWAIDQLDVTLPAGESLKVLGVGSGEGDVEFQLLTRVLTKYPAIHNTVVEPSPTQISLYKNLIREKGAELDGVEYVWHAQTLGEFKETSEESGDQTKFHLISALYCLYYESDMDAALDFLYSRLEPGGILLTGLETARCDMIKIEKHFRLSSSSMDKILCADDICAFYNKHRIAYTIFDQPDDQHEFDITDCFDDASHEGALVMDFLSDVVDFSKNVSQAVLKEFRDYLKGLATVKDGRFFLFYESDYIVSTKT